MLDILQKPRASFDAQVIFKLDGLETVASIKDTGPFNVTLTKGPSLAVGVDEHGQYIDFTGGNSFIAFRDLKLDCTEIEITLIISNVQYISSPYSAPIIDTRPPQTNGWYYIFSMDTQVANNLPRGFYTYYAGNETPPTTDKFVDAYRKITIKIVKDGIEYYFDDVFIGKTVGTTRSFSDQYYKLALSAYNNAVPSGKFRLYGFELKKIS